MTRRWHDEPRWHCFEPGTWIGWAFLIGCELDIIKFGLRHLLALVG